MKNNLLKSVSLVLVALTFQSCDLEDLLVPRNDSSIIPFVFKGRTTETLGTVFSSSRDISISIYDHGQIDGDIVSIYVNGSEVISNYELDGPSNPKTVFVTLENKGYNYILLYAHNEGTISPNTCSVVINDGVYDEEFILESDLLTNGAVDIIVD